MIIPLFLWLGCGVSPSNQASTKENEKINPIMNTVDSSGIDTATFGAGCFWCVEAVFQQLNGVIKVESGYEGGSVNNPTYKQVCTGSTGHAEVCRITFDTKLISYDDLLEVFWQTHDPTTLNRQGADVGTQYRSVVFYHNEFQKERAMHFKQKLNSEGAFSSPVITEISPSSTFYKAEDYHQNYYNENGNEYYCTLVIKPKLDKFKKAFSDKLK